MILSYLATMAASSNCNPVKDMALNSLVVCETTAVNNITIKGRLSARTLDIIGTNFATIDTDNVEDLAATGRFFGNLVSLQFTFALVAQLNAQASITVATVPSYQKPLGIVTGAALDSTGSKAGVVWLDADGVLHLTNTGSTNMSAADVISGSIVYLV